MSTSRYGGHKISSHQNRPRHDPVYYRAVSGGDAMSTEWDPFDPRFKADPYPVYEALVEEAPLYQSRYGPLLVSRYEDCITVLRHPAVSCDFRKSPDWSPEPGLSEDALLPSILNGDPPDHTRVRRLVSGAFTPRRVESLRPRMQQIVDRAFDRAVERGSMEAVAELAFPLPVLVICDLLGVPTDDLEQFKAWSSAIVRATDPNFALSPELVEQHAIAYNQLWVYFQDLIAERRGDLGDDLLSALLKVEQAGDRLSEPELMVNIILLLIAGHETTVNLIANGMLAFARYPSQFERLRNDPSLARSAVEEVLRFYPPVHLRPRVLLEDIPLSTGTAPAYSDTFLVFAAANRDPRQFEGPQIFDIGRANNRHLGFGFGAHFCVGAPLSRIEGEVVFEAMARRFSGIYLEQDPPAYKDNVSLPGVAALEVKFAP
ncbi:MAG TPA: cytochrome P450 [Acidimicrobiales bacterium]|nr:cytochrome P450 [Acidimicrobiales bacterium]